MALCRCGSGRERYALSDAAGIFVQYVCEICEQDVMEKYNPKIFDGNSTYAGTGDEMDLLMDDVGEYIDSGQAEAEGEFDDE